MGLFLGRKSPRGDIIDFWNGSDLFDPSVVACVSGALTSLPIERPDMKAVTVEITIEFEPPE